MVKYEVEPINQHPGDGPNKTTGCYACAHLKWDGGDNGDVYEEGFTCTKREYKTTREEYRHLDKLNDPGYLSRPKRCQEAEK